MDRWRLDGVGEGDHFVDVGVLVVEVVRVEKELVSGCKNCSVKSLMLKGLWSMVAVSVCLVGLTVAVHG